MSLQNINTRKLIVIASIIVFAIIALFLFIKSCDTVLQNPPPVTITPTALVSISETPTQTSTVTPSITPTKVSSLPPPVSMTPTEEHTPTLTPIVDMTISPSITPHPQETHTVTPTPIIAKLPDSGGDENRTALSLFISIAIAFLIVGVFFISFSALTENQRK